MHTIKCSSWNANGLRSHLADLRTFISMRKLDIIIINETKLTEDVSIKIKNFEIIRKDRTAHGGGVAILVRNNVPFRVLKPNFLNSIEHVCIKLADNTIIIAVYNQPRNLFSVNDLQSLVDLGNKILIIGDLNARHYTWKNHRTNHNGTTLYNFVNNNNIVIQHTHNPTHFPENGSTPTYIDLIINKNVSNITDPISVPQLSSDHNPILFQLLNCHKENTSRTVTSYKNTDWNSYRQYINDKLTIDSKIKTREDIDRVVQSLTTDINAAKLRHSTQIQLNPDKIELDEDILNLIRIRNRIRKQYQTLPCQNLKRNLNRLNRAIKIKIRTCLNKKWEKTLEDIRPGDRTLWRISKAFRKTATKIPTLKKNNQTFMKDQEKCEIISETLKDIQTNTATSEIEEEVTRTVMDYLQLPTNKLEIHLSNPKEIQQIIKTLPNNKAPGMDKINNKLIKNLPKKAVVQLMYIINGILQTGYFPDKWKIAVVIPIPKPGKDLTNPINYRPISLLSSLSKIAEKIILHRLKTFENKKKIIIDEQYGFRSGHNTSLQVARIAHEITMHYNKGNVTSMTLLDIEKAFDTVWIDGIIYKLIKYKFPSYLISLISNYLRNRKFTVNINSSYSDTKLSEAGVPQGSVLGPVIFTYFINDIPKFQKTKLAVYADDTAVIAHSFNAQVATKQSQIHCNQITDFTDTWKIKLNNSKTEQIIFSKKFTNLKVYEPLTIGGTKIQQADNEVKYLGVVMDKRLSFNPHVKNLLNKGIKALRALYPLLNKRSALSVKNKKLLYTAIIRPTITYAAPVWCSASDTQFLKVQRLQNKCLRLILSEDRYTRIEDLHRKAGIETIKEYTRKLSLKFFKTQIKKSNLTGCITDRAQLDSLESYKHKFIYHKLNI